MAERQATRTGFLKPSVAQVLAAVRSLYEDELRPYGRILLKRVRERAALAAARAAGLPEAPLPDVEGVALIDPKYLRRVCEHCSVFYVEPAEGKEYSVTLAGHRGVFVDPCSPRDPYPGQLWSEAADYFEGLDCMTTGQLPSGRYACAQVLYSRRLPFLTGRSLGELCHIVQLAISQKKILGYSEGNLVPYSQSEECIKERCAVRQQPAGTATEASLPFASWDQVRGGLLEILDTSFSPGPGMITLSNVKRLFRAQLNLELSETVLGYSRVGELLQDARLYDICSLQAMGNGQTMVQRVDLFPPMGHMQFCGMDPLLLQQQQLQQQQQQQQQLQQLRQQHQQQQQHFCPSSSSQQPACLSTCASNRFSTSPPLPPPSQIVPVPGFALVSIPLGSTFGSSSSSCPSYVPQLPEDPPCEVSPPASDVSCAPTERPETVSSEITGDDFELRSWASESVSFLESEGPCTPTRRGRAGSGAEDLQSPATLARRGFAIRNTFIDGSPRAESSSRRRCISVPKEI